MPCHRCVGAVMEAVMAKKYTSNSFDDFLEEEGILATVTETAMKQVIGWQIA